MKTLVFFGEAGWIEDPDFRHDAWQEEVLNENTQSGYIAWVIAQHEALGHGVDPTAVAMVEDHELPTEEEERAYPREDWLAEVEVLDTRLGYPAWVAHQVEANAV